jgi:uncharacterized tellurite resistance protein B-like protein
MESITFEELLLKTAFLCMAADGQIDQREVSLIISICQKTDLFRDIDYQQVLNEMIGKINSDGKDFIRGYFELLQQANLSENEELKLIDFAIKTINADEQIEYSEVKFFKNIRHRLKLSDEKILEFFPDIENYLERDIVTADYLDKITLEYLEVIDLPQFALLGNDIISEENQNS